MKVGRLSFRLLEKVWQPVMMAGLSCPDQMVT